MKKTCCIAALLAVLLVVSGVSFAQGSGKTNGKGVFKLDLEYERLDVDMEMVPASNTTDVNYWNNNFEAPYERDAAVLTASYGLCRYADALVSLGYMQDHMMADSRSGSGSDHTQEGDSAYLWKLGLKFNLYQHRSGFYLGGAANYSQWESGDDSYTNADGINEPRSFEVECKSYDASLYAGMGWKKFTAWAGVEYTEIDIDQHLRDYPMGDDASYKFELEDNWGALVGLTYTINKNFDVTVGGRFVNQTSFNLGVGYRF